MQRRALDLHQPDPADGLGTLAAIGGLEIAGLAGVIIGAAFGNIVTSLVGDIFMPIIGAVTGGLDFSNYFVPLSGKVTADSLAEAKKQGAVLAWGNFLTIMINFIIIAACLFAVVNLIQKLKAREEANDSYSTPLLWRGSQGPELILAGAEHVNAYDPKSGAEIWTVGGLSVNHPYGRTIAGPTAGDAMIIAVASGFQNRGYTVGILLGQRFQHLTEFVVGHVADDSCDTLVLCLYPFVWDHEKIVPRPCGSVFCLISCSRSTRSC